MKKIIRALVSCLVIFSLIACTKEIDPASQIVMDDIVKLTESETISLAEIERAKERYNSLTDEQKNQVNNYADLLKLENAYYDAVDAAVAQEEYEKTHYKGTDFLMLPEVADIGNSYELKYLENALSSQEWSQIDYYYYYDSKNVDAAEAAYVSYINKNFPDWTDSHGNFVQIEKAKSYIYIIIGYK